MPHSLGNGFRIQPPSAGMPAGPSTACPEPPPPPTPFLPPSWSRLCTIQARLAHGMCSTGALWKATVKLEIARKPITPKTKWVKPLPTR